MRYRHNDRDRRDHHYQEWNDHPGDADENEQRLALTRDQVEIAHRLREPDHDSQTDERDQERAHGGAKHVAADRPHRTEHPPLPVLSMAASIFDAAAAPAADLPKRCNFMRSQNGPAKAKLLNMHTKALIRPFEKRSRKKPLPE